MPPTQAFQPRKNATHATHASTPSSHPRWHATHATHASTNSTPFLKLRKKEYHLYRTYRKHHIFMYFLRKIIFNFPSEKKNLFWGKRNAIFPDDIRKIILQCNFFGKTIFSEHLKNISYFYEFFGERSSFIFRLQNKINFSEKKISSFLMLQERSYSSGILWEKLLFQKISKKKI